MNRSLTFTILLILMLSSCVPTNRTNPSRSLETELEVSTNPSGALITEMVTGNQYKAPVKLNYQWDKKYVVDNCLKANGFSVIWPDGTSASTEKVVTMCSGPNKYNITINKPNSIPPSSSSNSMSYKEKSVRYKENDLCSVISGANIIANDGKYLGKLTNEYGSDSIFNEYGTYGSEYGADSIWNEYGTYGSEYSSYSPFNEYTSSPPKIIKNGMILGYLTVNEYMQGAVNPYIIKSCLSSSSTSTFYVIEEAVNDEKFVINGELFEAQTFCIGWDEGDRVMFIDGSPFGACASAKLYNIDKEETCEVWCE